MESLLGWALTQSLNLWLDITCMSLFSLWNYLLWYIRSLYIMVPCLFLVRLLYVCELGFILVSWINIQLLMRWILLIPFVAHFAGLMEMGTWLSVAYSNQYFFQVFLKKDFKHINNFSTIFLLQNTTTVSLQLCVFNMWGCFLVYNQTINIFHNKSNRLIFHNNVYSEGKIST